MNTEQQIEIVKKYLPQKICFGLQHTGNTACRNCRLKTECAPLRRARLAYEERLLSREVSRAGDDAEYDVMMESMSKAKFEEMIARALRRGSGHAFAGSASLEAGYKTEATNRSIQQVPLQGDGIVDVVEQPSIKPAVAPAKGRPRTAKQKTGQVLALAAQGLTRQAIARELGISLASIYRILKENR
jgi:NADPH:quinone reductase-like Zn-dependent oxidoreductase